MYDAKLVRWNTYDPMAEKYYGINPYVYCVGDPVNMVDSYGSEIRGLTKKDIKSFREDLFTVLSGDKFENIRSLIDIKGLSLKKIDTDKLNSAMDALSLTEDESAYISMIAFAINSNAIYKVEYVSGDYVSIEGSTVFVNYMSEYWGKQTAEGFVDSDGMLSSAFIKSLGNGLNVPTRNGSYSFIFQETKEKDPQYLLYRALTSGHEVFGHGIPAEMKLNKADNNANAIRADNLIRRLLGFPQRDGSDHNGYRQGHIINPYSLPIR